MSAPERNVSAALGLEFNDLVGDDVSHDRGVPVGLLQVVEYTILGMSRHIAGNLHVRRDYYVDGGPWLCCLISRRRGVGDCFSPQERSDVGGHGSLHRHADGEIVGVKNHEGELRSRVTGGEPVEPVSGS
jgi:hypothetical protein